MVGLPTTIGTILVQDNKTGVVVAAMDGGLLTGVRTGASSGVATKHLARKNSKVAGVLGTGVMARSQMLALKNQRTSTRFSFTHAATMQPSRRLLKNFLQRPESKFG